MRNKLLIVLILIGLIFSGCTQPEEEILKDFNAGKPVLCFDIYSSKSVINKDSWKYSADLKQFYRDPTYYKIEDCWTKDK